MTHSHLPSEDPILEWSAPQHFHPERGLLWYGTAAFFVIGCIAYSIATAAWTFTILIALVTAIYWKTHGHEPEAKRMRIYNRGYAIEDNFVEWNYCVGYWIVKGTGFVELNIGKKNGTRTKILTGSTDPYALHDLLSPLLPELEDQKERALDTIIRICKL